MTSSKWTDVPAPYLSPPADGRTDAWQAEAAKRGRTGSQRLLAVHEVPAPVRVAAGLGVAPGSPVVLRRRLILLDGVPIEIADSYFLVGIARGTALAEAKKIRGGSVTLLASLGLVGKAADEEVEARQSTDEERSLLGIEVGEWVLHVLRTVRDPDGKPFEVTAMTMLARERILKYTVEIG